MHQAFNEACRLVALRLGQACESREYQSVVFASARPGESVTAIVTQVAWQLQSTFGLRPLIVRLRPELPRSRWLGFLWRASSRRTDNRNPESEPGATVLVLPSESTDHRASAIVPFLKKACTLMPERFDFLLVDAPAILESGETLEAAAVIPRVVLVVESGVTNTETLERIRSQLAGFHITLIGTVLRQYRNPMPKWMEKWLSQ